MADDLELSAAMRLDLGKAATRRLRRIHSIIPGIVYGADKKAVSIGLRQNEVTKALEHESFYSQIITLKLDGKSQKVVLKDLQRNPASGSVQHLDFMRISAKEKLTMPIPLHFINEDQCPGVKMGGIVSTIMNEVEVSCLPGDLPEYFEVDLSKLEMDQSLHLSELALPKSVELVALAQGEDEEHDQAIVSVHQPRVTPIEEEEVAAPEAAPEEGAEKPEAETPGEGESKE